MSLLQNFMCALIGFRFRFCVFGILVAGCQVCTCRVYGLVLGLLKSLLPIARCVLGCALIGFRVSVFGFCLAFCLLLGVHS